MTGCDVDVVLYFYGEMDAAERAAASAHLRGCAACRQRLADLDTIRAVLAAQPPVEAPPAGDWSGFMRRLDAAVKPAAAAAPAAVLERAGRGWTVRQVAALAAMLTIVTTTAARIADQKKRSMLKATSSLPDSQSTISSMAALTTKANRPSVRM